MEKAFTKWLAATLPLLCAINSTAQDILAGLPTVCQTTDSLDTLPTPGQTTKEKWLSGSFYTEANYGHNFFGANRDIYDFPHAVLDLDIRLGRGWSFTTEQEIEYLEDKGEWPTHFSQMYCCNWAYFEKEFSPGLRLRAGVLNVPVGLTSAYYGSGLTVYDPPSEDRVLPMKWHETGVALTGDLGKWEYYVAVMRHVAWLDTNPHDDENTGAAFRLNYRPNDALRLGMSGFSGKGAPLEDGFGSGHPWCNYAAFDFDYDRPRWLASGGVVYQSADRDLAVGAEIGFRATQWLIPFVRFDMVTCAHRTDYHETIAGINVMPLKNMTLKAQYSQDGGNVRMDMSINYTVEF